MKTEGCPKLRVVCVRESHFEIDKRKRDKIAEIYDALLGSKLRIQTLFSLIFEMSLFAENYFVIADLVTCLIANKVYLDITC